jgi:hypothetical protein
MLGQDQSDFIQDDSNDDNLPLYENYNSDIVQEKRCSHDCKVDNRDKQLLDLCIGSKLPFLNDRMWGDSYGKLTCIKPSGSSVVDYVIMTHVRKFTRKHIIFSSFRLYPHFIRLSL